MRGPSANRTISAALRRAGVRAAALGLLGLFLGVGRDLERGVELVLALVLAPRDVEVGDRDVLGLALDLLEELLELLEREVGDVERDRVGLEPVADDRIAR